MRPKVERRSQIWRVFLFFSLMAVSATKISASEYEVRGEIVQTLFKDDGGVQSIQRSSFTVFVRDCSWLIQTTDHDEAGKQFMKRETACLNGAEIYEVDGPPGGANSAVGYSGIRAWNVASIVSNNVPVGMADDYVVSHLWLMFASGCYFEKLSTNWITPVYDLNASGLVHPELKREAKWELINGPSSLPSSVIYLGTADMSIDATYLATGITNVDQVKIPNGFVFELRVAYGFAPGPIPPGESAPSYHIRKRALATAIGVRSGCSRSDLLPEADGMTTIIDRRLPPVPEQRGPAAFSLHDIPGLPGMVRMLTMHADKVAAFLWQKFSVPEQVMLTSSESSPTRAKLVQDAVLEVLNKTVAGPCIYESERFKGIALRPETTNLLYQKLTGEKLAHLNRLLLEDAFPVELSPPTRPSAYVVQNGVDWLPLEKAKEIYIKPPVPPMKRSSTVTVVFYASVILLSAVFLYFLNRLKPKRW
jgi:hypothetical protein